MSDPYVSTVDLFRETLAPTDWFYQLQIYSEKGRRLVGWWVVPRGFLVIHMVVGWEGGVGQARGWPNNGGSYFLDWGQGCGSSEGYLWESTLCLCIDWLLGVLWVYGVRMDRRRVGGWGSCRYHRQMAWDPLFHGLPPPLVRHSLWK